MEVTRVGKLAVEEREAVVVVETVVEERETVVEERETVVEETATVVMVVATTAGRVVA